MSGWFDTNWGYRREIQIPSSSVSGSLHSQFPLWVSLESDASLSANALANGSDIFFTAGDGTSLIPHQLMSYITGSVKAWVRVPELRNTQNTSIFLYYGNATPTLMQRSGSVWEKDYLAVWHLNEPIAGGILRNSAVHRRDSDLTPVGLDNTNNVAGKLHAAVNFVGDVAKYLTTPTVGSTFTQAVGENIHISYWLNQTSPIATTQSAFHWGSGTFNRCQCYHNSNGMTWEYSQNDTPNVGYATSTGSAGKWSKFDCVYDKRGLNTLAYYDGNLIGSVNNGGTPAATLDILEIGKWHIFGMVGAIEEFRVHLRPHDAGWIKTEYLNQNSPSTFYITGSVEVAPSATPAYYDTNYTRRRQITINSGSVTGSIDSFPMMFALQADADLNTYARSDGSDVIFTTGDGVSPLPIELENFVTGSIFAWIKVPHIDAQTNTTLYMYYGNPSSSIIGATQMQNASASVWTYGTDYWQVYHFGSKSGMGTGVLPLKDSSGIYSFTGSIISSVQDSTVSPLAGVTSNLTGSVAMFFSGSAGGVNGTYIDAGAPQNIHPYGESPLTAQLWYSPATVAASYRRLLFYGGTQFVIIADNGGHYYVTVGTDGVHRTQVGAVGLGQWGSVALTWDGRAVSACFNGDLFFSRTEATVPFIDELFYTLGGTSGLFYSGSVDEIRLHRGAISAAWLKTEFNNQSNPLTFYTVSSPTSPPSPPTSGSVVNAGVYFMSFF